MLRPLLTLCLVACSCSTTDPLEDRWELVWKDEFDGAEGASPDAESWVAEIGTGPNDDGWGNGQLEYNSGRPDNVSLNGQGQLRIVAKREAYEGSEWTSARIKTQGLQAFTYGAIEAGIKLPEGRGLWPAFWMLGSNIGDVGWPTCGEIDIMEFRGSEPNRVLGTIHGPGYAGGASVGGDLISDAKWSDAYHVFRIEWDVQHIGWYVDGELMHTAHPGDVNGAPWVFNHDFFILLNLAVGGNFLPNPDNTTPGINEMLVDYVRVYERRAPFTDPLAVP